MYMHAQKIRRFNADTSSAIAARKKIKKKTKEGSEEKFRSQET